MLTTSEALELVRAENGGCTDYKLAQILGVSKTAVMKWRDGRHTFDEKNALRIAHLLKIDPHFFLASIQAEKAKNAGNDDASALWLDIAGMVSEKIGFSNYQTQAPLPI